MINTKKNVLNLATTSNYLELIIFDIQNNQNYVEKKKVNLKTFNIFVLQTQQHNQSDTIFI